MVQLYLVRPDGSRFRIWGINATGAAALPATREPQLDLVRAWSKRLKKA